MFIVDPQKKIKITNHFLTMEADNQPIFHAYESSRILVHGRISTIGH
ncbi:hypothetical protein glysoja_023511 [Glycine soja]|nr:hypothetical protein glysoja_023511 [Glycine soja]